MHTHLRPIIHAALRKARSAAAAIAALALVAACSKTEAPPPPPTAAPHAATVATSICDHENAVQEGVQGISKQDGEILCRAMSAKLGRDPSAKLLAMMEKFLFGLRAVFKHEEAAKDFANNVMSIIEARQQIGGADDAMVRTMNVVAKCYSGSQGRTTPRDIAATMRAMGDAATTISDDGMYSLCAVVDVQKGGGDK